LASNGYPASYPTGDIISGFENIPSNSFVFHAGTKKQNNKIISNGGRVLGVTALGATLQDAIDTAYDACKKIQWSNKYQRNDIGKKGLSSL
jgi:phosphoribosylamine--glycine ligase